MSGRIDFANELESASDRIADISRADLQIMLRRAALRLRNTGGIVLAPPVEDALTVAGISYGHERKVMVVRIIQDWLETNGYLLAEEISEDSDTDGSA